MHACNQSGVWPHVRPVCCAGSGSWGLGSELAKRELAELLMEAQGIGYPCARPTNQIGMRTSLLIDQSTYYKFLK